MSWSDNLEQFSLKKYCRFKFYHIYQKIQEKCKISLRLKTNGLGQTYILGLNTSDFCHSNPKTSTRHSESIPFMGL